MNYNEITHHTCKLCAYNLPAVIDRRLPESKRSEMDCGRKDSDNATNDDAPCLCAESADAYMRMRASYSVEIGNLICR